MQETLVQFLGQEDHLEKRLGYPLWYSWASLVSQTVKNLPAMQETWVGKIPWRRAWQPSPVFLPGERILVGCHPWGLQRVRHDWATKQSTIPHWLMHHIFLIQSPTKGHLGCVKVWAIVNKTVVLINQGIRILHKNRTNQKWSICLSINIYISIYLYVCLSIYLSSSERERKILWETGCLII